MKIGVLCSGNLGFQILNKLFKCYEIAFVFSDFKSESIINFCKKKQIDLFLGNPRNGKCSDFINEKQCDILLSINYLYIIEYPLIDLPKKYAINIHGSLLPKYRGRTPHVWAIINNEKTTGVTAHLIDEKCDNGDIIQQIEIKIEKNDTGAIILEKFQKEYWPLIQNIIGKIENQSIKFRPQDQSKATYFGKRTPDDGKIDWNWQKERIYNWIRAQASPYPGAFCYLNGQKLIIDEISFSNYGFHSEIPNGTILSINPIKVKTCNGVIQIERFRGNLNLDSKSKYKLE